MLDSANYCLICIATCVAFLLLPAAYATEPIDPRSELDSVFRHVKPAVVRIATDERGHSAIGTIVTSDGRIVLHEAAHLKKEPFIVFLPDGRRTTGILLGWSSEWNISLAIITDKGPWPCVEMVTSTHVPKLGDVCFMVGYTLTEKAWRTSPELRMGSVARVASKTSFATTIRTNEVAGQRYFDPIGPIFDAEGKLMGNTAVVPVGGDAVCLHSRQLRELWPLMAKRKNVDRERLLHVTSDKTGCRPYSIERTISRHETVVRERIVASTVRLQRDESSRGGSGVIISPEGFVATCAHGGRTPGDKVAVKLSDGRIAEGIVSGTNPITDIAVVKIVDEGPWPFAPLCDSSDLAIGTPCWFVGYPAHRTSRHPLVRKTSIVRPEKSEWSHILYTDKSYSQFGGDSGGGVFDMSGRLLAINQGKESDNPGRHPRIETFRVQWNTLVNAASVK